MCSALIPANQRSMATPTDPPHFRIDDPRRYRPNMLSRAGGVTPWRAWGVSIRRLVVPTAVIGVAALGGLTTAANTITAFSPPREKVSYAFGALTVDNRSAWSMLFATSAVRTTQAYDLDRGEACETNVRTGSLVVIVPLPASEVRTCRPLVESDLPLISHLMTQLPTTDRPSQMPSIAYVSQTRSDVAPGR